MVFGVRSVVFLLFSCHFLVSTGVIVKLKKAENNKEIFDHIRRVRESQERTETTDPQSNTFVSLLQTSDDRGTLLAGFKSIEYHGDVTIGGKTYDMLFDTSTAHTWIPASSCQTCCPVAKDYQSPVVTSPARPMFEQFPDGTWLSGVAQTTDIQFSEELEVKDLTYFQIYVKGSSVHPYPDFPQQSCSDNVVGLGFSTRFGSGHTALNPDTTGHQRTSRRQFDVLETRHSLSESLIERLHSEHLITSPVFTLYLTHSGDDSEIELGSINHKRVLEKYNPNGLFWVNAVGFPDFHWAFNVPRICFDHECYRTGNIPARISSTVPYIALPEKYYKVLRQPHERVTNPCQIKDHLPLMSLVAIGTDEEHISNRYSANLPLCANDYTMELPDGQCDFAIVPTKLPMIILGTPFLRKFFTAFDIEQKRMGFAQVTETCEDEGFDLDDVMVAMQKMKKEGTVKGPEDPEFIQKLQDTIAEGQTEMTEHSPPFLQDGVVQLHHNTFID